MAELLAEAAMLSKEEIEDQLTDVITSEKAQKQNQERNIRLLKDILFFGEVIINNATLYARTEASLIKYCQFFVEHFKQQLQYTNTIAIKAGYMFDPIVLYYVTRWYNKNINRFENNIARAIFIVNGLGNLQKYKLSSRDAQIYLAGIQTCIKDSTIPYRSLKTRDENGLNLFNSDLGDVFHLDSHGEYFYLRLDTISPYAKNRDYLKDEETIFLNLTLNKNNSIVKLIGHSSSPTIDTSLLDSLLIQEENCEKKTKNNVCKIM